MKILFLHPNMPGQYKHLAQHFAKDPSNQVVFVTKPKDLSIKGVHKVGYAMPRDASASTHRYIIGAERAVLQGQEVWRVCKKLKTEEGFVPDIVCAHPGWGDALYIKDIYPDAPLLNYCEFYYHSTGADVGFDPAHPVTEDDRARVRTKNITNLLNLDAMDWGITPTHWQWKQHPVDFQHRISVLHDGIDTDYVQPNPNMTITLPGGKVLGKGDEVVTYVARNFEPYRGFPTFMQAAERILRARPNCHIIAIGADDVSYGRRPPQGTTYRQMWSEKVQLDPERMHFIAPLPYNDFLKILQVSSAHIYLTYPFVLSWSMLESMAAECLLIASNTAPVTEVIRDGETGLLVDFFSPDDVARRVDEVFAHPDRMQAVRRNARQYIRQYYDIKNTLPLHVALIEDLASGQTPPLAASRIRQFHSAI